MQLVSAALAGGRRKVRAPASVGRTVGGSARLRAFAAHSPKRLAHEKLLPVLPAALVHVLNVRGLLGVYLLPGSQNRTVHVNPQDLENARFTEFDFSPTLHEAVAAAGYEKPTPVQAACIPHALRGVDLIGLAQTGTGKTAAFALPIINRLGQRPEMGALVLAPTRELAAQITKMFVELGTTSGIRVATIVGGVHMDHDEKALLSWPNVIVGTPGRLIDHIQQGRKFLNEVEVLVIDEADRMHDMGFIPQIRQILRALPEKRQTMMFTATMPPDVERVARMSMKDPLRIQVGRRSAPAERARQQLFYVTDEQKTPLLVDLLRQGNGGRVLVFVRTKRGVDRLARVVRARGFNCASIHGDREQAERNHAMAGFREGRYKILIATDIAARGLDIANIEHVINYDFPMEAEDYVHRIGRTARVDAVGLASSFVTRADSRFLAGVRQLVGDCLPQAVRPGQPPVANSRPAPHRPEHNDAAAARHERHGRKWQPRPQEAQQAVAAEPAPSVQPAAGPVPAAAAQESSDQDRGPRRRRRGGRGRSRRGNADQSNASAASAPPKAAMQTTFAGATAPASSGPVSADQIWREMADEVSGRQVAPPCPNP